MPHLQRMVSEPMLRSGLNWVAVFYKPKLIRSRGLLWSRCDMQVECCTYLGFVEYPIIVGIISEGFLNASSSTGNVVVTNRSDFDRHGVAQRWKLGSCVSLAHGLCKVGTRAEWDAISFPRPKNADPDFLKLLIGSSAPV